LELEDASSVSRTGLELGDGTITAVLAVLFVLVTIAMTRSDREDPDAPRNAHRHGRPSRREA
jgi:hypothetical protein